MINGCNERVLNSTVRLANSLGIPSQQIPKPLDLTKLRLSLLAIWPNAQRTPHAHQIRSTAQAIDAAQLAMALDRGEIVPWFQPKVELATGHIVGCEALARWQSPKLGMVATDLFMPIVESAGLMPRLTGVLLRAATQAIRGIVEQNPGFSVAVNVSASLLSDLSLANVIGCALTESNLPPTALTVEVTESTAMSDITKATDILVGLRVKGVGVSIDDFGTGYSSLAALARMPFSELKIDSLFVRDIETDRDMARVARACVQLGHELGMKVVAEGIETAAVWNRLLEAGCDIGQGFAFAPALDAPLLAAWIEQWRGREEKSILWPGAKGLKRIS